ncbi:MAG: monodechloroaminopyrrolnitrin synthase PrnB family protein [Cytophagales bacterium]
MDKIFQLMFPEIIEHDPEKIQSLDIMNMDENWSDFHSMNKSKDIGSILELLKSKVYLLPQIEVLSYFDSIALMRDLGIFIGVIKKLGFEPVFLFPKLNDILLELAEKTNLPPRDTLSHYTLWNPDGPRMRTYTGEQQEKDLITSVKIAFPDLLLSIKLLDNLYAKDYFGEEFDQACYVVKESLESMIDGVVYAKKTVSPEFFANELRHYYEPILVDRQELYIGPGAVEMPMFLVDHILWNCDLDDNEYTQFKKGYLPYNIQWVRDIYSKYESKPSIFTKISNHLEIEPTKRNIKSAETFLGIYNTLKSFRMPHKKLAEKVYAHNSEQHKNNGSGGYTVSILHKIIDLQNACIEEMSQKIDKAKMLNNEAICLS